VIDYFLDVLANDDDGDPLVGGAVVANTDPTGGGTLKLIFDNGDIIGFEYTPPADADYLWDGISDYAEFTDTFMYKAKDAEGNVSVNTATVTISVRNFLPVGGGADILESKNVSPIEVTETNPSFTFVIGTDVDGDDVWIETIDQGTAPGTVTPIEDAGKTIGFEYTPDLDQAQFTQIVGDQAQTVDYAKITYTVTDGLNTSKEENKGVVDVDLFNLLPSGSATPILESKNVSPIDVTDPKYSFVIGADGDDPSVWIETIDTAGVPGTITEIKDGDKIIGFEFTPDLDQAQFTQIVGDQAQTVDYAQITYTVTDGFNTSQEGDDGGVNIDLFNLLPSGSATPILESKNVSPIDVTDPKYSFVIGTDGDDPSVWIETINTAGVPGTITEIKDGDKIIGFDFTPDLDQAQFTQIVGDQAQTVDYAQITYTVTDGFNTSQEGADGIVDVDLFNLLPSGSRTHILKSKNVSHIGVTETDPSHTFEIGTDLDGDPVWIVDGSIKLVSSPGSFTPIMDGDKIIGFEYTPDLGAASFSQIVGDQGETVDYAQFSYQVTDGFNTSQEGADGIVDVDLFNKLPVARPDTYLMGQDDVSLVVPVDDGVIIDGLTGRDFDPDGDPLQAFLDNGGFTTQGGTISLNEDGSFTYIPPDDFAGEDTFAYFVNDGFNDSASVEVLITLPETPPPAIPAAPLPQREIPEIGGCPALMNWLASELGVGSDQVQVYMANVMAWSKSIQPCSMCARLQTAAATLADPDGVRIAALAQVVNEYVTPAAPMTDEQMALIAAAFAQYGDEDTRFAAAGDEGLRYAMAGEWVDALVAYVGILSTEMGMDIEDALALLEKYLEPVNESENEALVAYVQAQLAIFAGL
jgi:hypothetical protein